jgi:hypothetical protein
MHYGSKKTTPVNYDYLKPLELRQISKPCGLNNNVKKKPSFRDFSSFFSSDLLSASRDQVYEIGLGVKSFLCDLIAMYRKTAPATTAGMAQ